MKSKKLLLGALMALAIGTSGMNLFAADPGQQCKWKLNPHTCVCFWDAENSYPNFIWFCDFDACATWAEGCNPQ